ncbi:conserved protein, unknown function [Plasmodium berghei]|uniref:PPPDE peptidase domain-containing protein, putative n=2 Tax=Plasmodium berghei TaxID=5821 RepID=A0A509AT06_PLABA|nr:PPPDE peptidase domain-containing protein, putative [Plasmodium berghei ANKA]CXJ20638.1 conserved protein, unknown function [Plasmodium berghei]SCM26549.1 conserved protein, unknown function [Plasmodium berghei]SCN28514.1 conserved protein, unknown function [Plasmodium berghei]SCO62704.1 conserved protein, unknown function [Plasmodium berghei]SCO64265.1 conserved protein, unknown function [Plasmodium berghei]|eukprot:XP_034424160.1 PPPDE peptidase domain-containing protein, putative [Plasmodium berghei ANKA]
MATTYNVKLKIYDLSRGMVKLWSPLLIGKQIGGVWHTAVLIYNMEYFYGGGIMCLPPNEFESHYNIKPVEIIDMGETEVDKTFFHDYLDGIRPNFTTDKYNLINWNCNNFTNEACNFLLGKGIPQYILNTPYEVMSTPKGKLILDMMQSCQTSIAPGMENSSTINSEIKNDSISNNNDSQKNNETEYSKVPSVSMDNFFTGNKINIIFEDYLKSDKCDSNEKKKIFNSLSSFFRKLINNLDILQNRIIYKKNNEIFNNVSNDSEYNKILSYIGFVKGYVEIDEINNLQVFTLYIDSKYNKNSPTSKNIDLFINKKIYLKSLDSSIYKVDLLSFKNISEYVLDSNTKKTNVNEVYVFLSEYFISNHFDITNSKNDNNNFRTIKSAISSDLETEKQYLINIYELVTKHLNLL